MKITLAEREDIRWGLRSMDLDNTKKKLFKLYNSNLEDVFDYWFVRYNLAWIMNKLGYIELAKNYISEVRNYILDINEEGKYTSETYKTLWLYIELCKEELSKDELLFNYKCIKDKLSYLGETESEEVLGIDITIHMLNEQYDEALEIYSLCLQRQYIDNVNNTLEFLNKNNLKQIYEKALSQQEKYNMAINVTCM